MNFPSNLLSIKTILAPIQKQLDRVEGMAMENLETEIPLLTEVGQYILQSGGKRIRPALLLLSANTFGFDGEEACQAANVIEYIHTATLLHDDVVDNAALRRSKKTARSIWGNEASVLVGDYLFTVSFKYLAAFQNIAVIERLSKATTMMARGEILQLTRSFDSSSIEDYFEIVYHKTASLMGASMSIGAVLGGADLNLQDTLENCGIQIGMAFQMVDDVLDYSINNQQLGKDIGSDLKERKITLPLSHLLVEANDLDLQVVTEILDEDEIKDKHVKIVGKLVQKYKSLEYTLDEARKSVYKAKQYLSFVPANPFSRAIAQIADYILTRNK